MDYEWRIMNYEWRSCINRVRHSEGAKRLKNPSKCPFDFVQGTFAADGVAVKVPLFKGGFRGILFGIIMKNKISLTLLLSKIPPTPFGKGDLR